MLTNTNTKTIATVTPNCLLLWVKLFGMQGELWLPK